MYNTVDNVSARYIVFISFQAFWKSVCCSIVKTKILKPCSKQFKFFPNFYKNCFQDKYWEANWKIGSQWLHVATAVVI